MKISIATNISNADLPRIKNIIPHWLEVFDENLGELLLIYDNNELSGRIKQLHKQQYTSEDILGQLNELTKIDPRVKVLNLDYSELEVISRKWFKKGSPVRCQNGSPIYTFLYAIDKAKYDIMLKCDCDIVTYENGFTNEAIKLLDQYDIVSPPRNPLPGHTVSSRGFFINRKKLYGSKLPIVLPKLSLIQIAARIYRRQDIFDSKKYSLYFSLERAINDAIDKGVLTHTQIDKKFGNTLHIISNGEANDPIMTEVVNNFKQGKWPKEQEEFSMDYSKPLWEKFLNK
ncbi:hypothetical protein GR160_12105 [Flavobacterium sp. Sd200]|uniref:hypothetical protein n=1 Tax=Flavobacterium sp. Sd200 TaxID=2692211 RepID=UPI00136DFA15|nr:hypothetical protein [Flavobacterium sp. Sd200]MXN91968.1 hypothetical protein [Flavobacterium sp. Sd200]